MFFRRKSKVHDEKGDCDVNQGYKCNLALSTSECNFDNFMSFEVTMGGSYSTSAKIRLILRVPLGT